MESELVKKIVEERQSKAEQERQQAEQRHEAWQQQEDFRFACERVSRFSPCESMDPEWDMWHDQPPSRGYWLNYAEAIIELVNRGQAAGRDIVPHLEHTGSAMRDVATDVYRLALDGKPEPVADLLEAISTFDDAGYTDCRQWIKTGLPRLFQEGTAAEMDDNDEPEPRPGKADEPSDADEPNDKNGQSRSSRPARRKKRPGHSLKVSIEKLTATLDGKEYDLDEQPTRWLKVLLNNKGKWISSSQTKYYDDELDGARTDRLKKSLPKKLSRLIETSTYKGSRLKLA